MNTLIKGIFISLLLLITHSVYAEELSDEKKALIDELIVITGAVNIGEMMGNAAANQMIAALAQQKGEIPPHIVEIVKDETAKIMHDEFVANRWIYTMSYDLYHKYFTTEEIQELVNFYKTPTGAKVVKVLPQLTQESMIAGQKHGQSLAPVIQKRFKERFAKEGIE